MIERADRAPRVLGLHFAIAGAAHSDDGFAASGGDGAVCVAGCSFDEWRCEEPHAQRLPRAATSGSDGGMT